RVQELDLAFDRDANVGLLRLQQRQISVLEQCANVEARLLGRGIGCPGNTAACRWQRSEPDRARPPAPGDTPSQFFATRKHERRRAFMHTLNNAKARTARAADSSTATSRPSSVGEQPCQNTFFA